MLEVGALIYAGADQLELTPEDTEQIGGHGLAVDGHHDKAASNPHRVGGRHQALRGTGHLERSVDASSVGPGLHDLSHVGGRRINCAKAESVG